MKPFDPIGAPLETKTEESLCQVSIELVRSKKQGVIDARLVDLAILISRQLPRMRLSDILGKVREEKTWKSYVISSVETGMVLGGCVLREHKSSIRSQGLAELFLLAVNT